jgi:hypothetical protein
MVGRWKMMKLRYLFIRKIFVFVMFLILAFSITNISGLRLDGKPDLIIESYNLPNDIVEGDEVEFIINIENIVNEDTGEFADIAENTEIIVALSIDGTVVNTNSSDNGLKVNESIFINVSWTATLGSENQRDVRIEVNPSFIANRIPESRYVNNFRLDTIEVVEKGPDLTITNVDIPEELIVNKSTTIIATIKNNGGATDRPIYAKLNSSICGEIANDTQPFVLPRDEEHNFTFEWIPENFGSQKITVDIIYEDKTQDFKEISVIVEIGKLIWWNENWHYRYILSVNGAGTVKYFLNFTAQLNSLGISSGMFENDTLRLVQYQRNGSIIKEVTELYFNESEGFDPTNNAKGDLLWNVSEESLEKFFCIYFDVKENIGVRTNITEDESLVETGNAQIGQFSYVEGWYIEILSPTNGSFALISQTVDFDIFTSAKSDEIAAFIYLEEDKNHNFSLSFDNENNTHWFNSTDQFDEGGNWIIRLNGTDGAGFKSEDVISSIYIGKPDVKIENITIKTIRDPSSSDIYLNDIVNVTAEISSINANIEKVNISLTIKKSGTIVFSYYSLFDVMKNKISYVHFQWTADIMGSLNFSITVDPENIIDEQNESNNKVFKSVTVSIWPDLSIEEIIIPGFEIMEFDTVEIGIVVKNLGSGSANNYLLNLYIARINTSLKFSDVDKKDSTNISLVSNATETFYLEWDSAKAGSWQVAALIVYNDTKRDLNETNNVLRLKKALVISGYERNPPVIQIIDIDPEFQFQGGPISIKAKIKDDTGLDSVTIEISFNGSSQPVVLADENMRRIGDDNFIYEFFETYNLGRYEFQITAIDLSVNENIARLKDNFMVSKDLIPPTIESFSANPEVQLAGKNVEINSIVSDNNGIRTVKVNITNIPTGESSERFMALSSNGVYTYVNTYDEYGKYRYFIISEDISGEITSTEFQSKFFWVTPDLSDADNDGMSDYWEMEYGLDPRSPNDATEDMDGDGVNNLEEFENDGNPTKDIFSENAAYRIKENIAYLASSVVLFIVLFVLFLLGIRRRN